VTIHDLIYLRHPEAHPGIRSLGMRALVPLAAHRAHRVIADSRSTRDDLVARLGLAPAKVDVVPLGLGSVRRGPALAPPATRDRFRLGDRRVLLSLSAKRPHKNLGALIGALGLIAPERRPVLVLPGYPTWHEDELRARAAACGVTDDVRFLSWIPAAELEGLWGVSDAFVLPSLYEGFGLPILEAMARGVPVACADRSSLPEVAGGAALLFDPASEAAIAGAIERILGDAGLAAELRRAGAARAAEFTWERSARATLAVYDSVLAATAAAGRA
jgi:glycosyltransferase involved in cell wall biosynthesis